MRTAEGSVEADSAELDRQVPSVETEPFLDLNERDAPIPAASAPQRRLPDDATLPADATSKTGGHCSNANARDCGSQENGDSEYDSASFCPPTSTAPPGGRSPGARSNEILTADVPLGVEAVPGSHESSSNGSNSRSDDGVSAAAQGAEASPPSEDAVSRRQRTAREGSSLAEGETAVPVDADSSSSSEKFESRPPSPSISPVEPLPASDSEDNVKLSRASPSKDSSGGAEADRDGGAPVDEGVPATTTTTPSNAPRITPSQSRPSPQRRSRAPLDATLHDAAARVDAEGIATEQELLEALRARERGEGAQTAPGINKGEDDGTAAPGAGELEAETKAADGVGGDDTAGLAAIGTAAEGAAAAAVSMGAGDVPGARDAAFSVLDRDDIQGGSCFAPIADDYVFFRQLQEPHMVFIQYQLAVLGSLIFMILICWRRHGSMISALYAPPAFPDARGQIAGNAPS